MILRGDLVPGQRLAEAPLADSLGMSRTPVRQALPLLAQEGLLSEHITRGYVVRSFTPSDVVDAIDMRGALEGLAARRIAERGASRALLRGLRECLEDGDSMLAKRHAEASDEIRYAEMNTRFHALILREAGSPILAEALERVSRVSFAGPQALALDASSDARRYDMLFFAHRQHHSIVDALERGQASRVEALMREHANSPKESIKVGDFHVTTTDDSGRVALMR